MNLLGPISEIMSTELITLSPSASIAEVAKVFDENRIHHILVAIEDKLIGLVSMSDYLFFKRGFLDKEEDKRIEEIRMNNYEIKHIMTQGLATLEPNQRIIVALEIFKENFFHAIPIVEDELLKGILTTQDIINALAEDKEAYTEYEN